MPRGIVAKIGTERRSPNGYIYKKTEYGWELIHRLIAEEELGRRLKENEYVTFKDGNKDNLDPRNIIVRVRGRTSIRRRLAAVEARILDLQAARDALLRRVDHQEKL